MLILVNPDATQLLTHVRSSATHHPCVISRVDFKRLNGRKGPCTPTLTWPDSTPYALLYKDLLPWTLIWILLLCSYGIFWGWKQPTGQNKPLTPGKRQIINTYEPSTVCQACSGALPHSFDMHSNPEKKRVFSLFSQMRPSEASGVSELREQGSITAEWGMQLSLPANLAWDGAMFSGQWERIWEGWGVSECLLVPVYIHAPKLYL